MCPESIRYFGEQRIAVVPVWNSLDLPSVLLCLVLLCGLLLLSAAPPLRAWRGSGSAGVQRAGLEPDCLVILASCVPLEE